MCPVKYYDKIILGAGIYGLYSAIRCLNKNESVLILETDSDAFSRASYINQSRIHMGYHYPRSLPTAKLSKDYYERFCNEFDYSINDDFEQMYAISNEGSKTSSKQFVNFCKELGIEYKFIENEYFFKENVCESVFSTKECSFDAGLIKEKMVSDVVKNEKATMIYNVNIHSVERQNDTFLIKTNVGSFASGYVLNTTYASINQIQNMFGYKPIDLKYELCEIILCTVSDNYKEKGITVMDGPFFSIMPFGKTGLYSLSSVEFTPHMTSFSKLPTFSCQKKSNGYCTPYRLGNCNLCIAKPKTSWEQMRSLMRHYLKDDYDVKYVGSLYAIKPILKASEIDDSRPTKICVCSTHPFFISVLSGKINTVFELDKLL